MEIGFLFNKKDEDEHKKKVSKKDIFGPSYSWNEKKKKKKTRNFYYDVYPLVAFMSECKMIGE